MACARFIAVATAALTVATLPSAATASIAPEAAMQLSPNRFAWDEASAAAEVPSDPVTIVVSIADQRAYVYRGEALIAASSVSTGKDDKPTPTGSFTILQKEETHHSNLYQSAPMPFMQRLTWDGVAIHAGRNPGFPASHGCIRVPTEFAKRLYGVTRVGTVVVVVDEPVTDPETMHAFEMPDVFDSRGTAAANGAALAEVAAR